MQRKTAIARQPLRQARNALPPAARLGQAERRLRGARVGYVPALIALAPILELQLDVASGHDADLLEQLQQTDRVRRTAAEIESTPVDAIDILQRGDISV